MSPKRTVSRRGLLAGAGALAGGAALSLTGCGKAQMGKQRSPFAAAAAARSVTLPKMSWVGSEANVAVAKWVLEKQLDYHVDIVMIDELPAWDAVSQGRIDGILEDWGHLDRAKTYCDEKKTLVRAGNLGVVGHIGWYVPKYFADEHPDITDWRNLNKYAHLLRTAESGDKGQLMDGSPAYDTYDKQIVANLGLNYEVVFAGSEAAQITQMRQCAKQKKPYLTYWYVPQWLNNEIPMVEVKLPKYTAACVAKGKEKRDCGYAVTPLGKYLNAEFARSGSDAAHVLKALKWSEHDQNTVSLLIADKGVSAEDAADRWCRANPHVWKKWLPPKR